MSTSEQGKIVRRPYVKPAIRTYGDLRALTKAAVGNGIDNSPNFQLGPLTSQPNVS